MIMLNIMLMLLVTIMKYAHAASNDYEICSMNGWSLTQLTQKHTVHSIMQTERD